MSRPSQAEIENWFMYHPPTEIQIAKYLVLREKGKEMARCILSNCPEGPDRTVAIRKLREVVMIANASIACDEVPDPGQRDFTGGKA